jgi:formylglycine-generating enzyme required for sulfatase activity
LQAGTVATVPTGGTAFPLCQGGYPNLYDMSGNASEWEDGCVGSDCPSRGGDYNSDWDTSPESLKCSSAWLAPRMQRTKYRGFRCCWDASVQ